MKPPLGIVIDGNYYAARSAIGVLVLVFEELGRRDDTFLKRFEALPNHGRTRRYLAKDRCDLYPGRPDLAINCAHKLSSGLWLGTNYSKRDIKKIIQLACEVANIELNEGLKINLGD